MTLRSTLYAGSVMHRRVRPRVHRLRYRVFWMLLDLNEIECLPRHLRLFSHNRFNAVSFFDRDHGDGSDRPLRTQIEEHLKSVSIESGGPIQLLCMPRIFGYGFNPLSVYFCYQTDGALAAILYEVHNTFRQRHWYLIRADRVAGPVVDQRCNKLFYVSPFMDMDMSYTFRVALPDERIALAIRAADKDGLLLVAALSGNRRPLTDGALLRLLAVYPLLTLKVMGAIHWHALRLLLKGMRLRARPNPPDMPVTVVNTGN
jgi:uncharacterized protein